MPLVPMSLVKEWYKVDSFLYRQFAFTFKNAVWQKPVPKGAAICPMFWTAIFSMVILRPVIGAILIARWLARLLRLTSALRWTDTQVMRVFGADGAPKGLGAPTSVVALIVGVISGIIWIWSTLLYGCIIGGTVSLFILAHTLIIGGFLAAELDDETEIKPLYIRAGYWVLSALTVGIAAFARPDLFVNALGPIWEIISYLASESGGWVWARIAGTWDGCVNVLALTMMYWWAVLAYIGALGLCAAIGWRHTESRVWVQHTYLDVKLRKVRAAIREVVDAHVANYLRWHGTAGVPNLSLKAAVDYARSSQVTARLIREIVDSEAWLKIDLTRIGLSISGERMTQIAEAVLAEWQEERKAIKRAAIWQARIQRILNALGRAATWCATTRIYKTLMCVWRGVRFMIKQMATLVCLVWEVIKARKQGWCPYLTFQVTDTQAPARAPQQPAA